MARTTKIHLFDVAIRTARITANRAAWSRVRSLRGGTAGGSWVVDCYDVRFPHLYRRLAQAGAEFLAIPGVHGKTGAAHWHTLVRARAIETGSYVFAPGQCGVRSWGRRTYGHSLVVDPWGEVLADGGEDEGIILATVDTARVSEVRGMIPSLLNDPLFAGPGPR